MPTTIRSRTLTPQARLRLDAGPFAVVILASLLLGMVFWTAFAPRPIPDIRIAAVQGAY